MKFKAPPVNWEQQIKNLLDSYSVIYDHLGINLETAEAHAVQKEAIQNSMDAYDPKNPDVWTVTFELYLRKPSYVTITDTRTFGLTGKANLDEEELSKLNYKEYLNERWSRFEALGYANPDPRARGARGQGKFVFIGSSEKKEMIYETLRADGVYRVGHWITRGAKPLIEPLEGDDAKRYLAEHAPFLKPIDRVGTRIIIVEPIRELINAFMPLLDCDLKRYISETWWEPLLNGRRIYIKIQTRTQKLRCRVLPPPLFQDLYKHPEKFKHYRVIRDDYINFSRFGKAKVKEFRIAYSEEEIPEIFRGIAVQRGGMKVMTFDIREGNEHIEERYKKHIFGWITFNEEAEELLRDCERPNHYGFIRTRGSLAFEVLGTRGWLSRQIRRFAEEELGIFPEKKKRVAMDRVQAEVIYYLNKIVRSLGFEETTKIGIDREVGGKRGKTTPVRIQMPVFVFPGSTRRVNFNDEISGIRARIINDSKDKVKVNFEMALWKGGRLKKITEKPIKELEPTQEVILPPHSKTKWYGPYSIHFSKKDFEPGQYTLKSQIVSLSEKRRGEVLHKITRAIYVEVDPPAIGRFRRFEYSPFPENMKKLRYWVDEEDKALVIKINIEHPLYKRALKINEEMQRNKKKEVNALHDYLLDIGLAVLIKEDLFSKAKLLGKEGKSFLKLIERDYEGIHEKIYNIREKLHQELLYDAYA